MTLTVAKVEPHGWYAGMLQDVVTFDNGSQGRCNNVLYRNRMLSVTVQVNGVGRRGFALATMPADWCPKVGDMVTVHPSQL